MSGIVASPRTAPAMRQPSFPRLLEKGVIVTVDMTAVTGDVRPHVGGTGIDLGDQTLCVRGVTYRTFHPTAEGTDYYDPERVARDFAQIAAHGLNAVRTYTVPPRWLLDAAQWYLWRGWRASTDA
jgi:hypothetical protein